MIYIQHILNFVLLFKFCYTFDFIFLLNLIAYHWQVNSFSSEKSRAFIRTYPHRCPSELTWIHHSNSSQFWKPVTRSEMLCYMCPNCQWLLLHNPLLCLENENSVWHWLMYPLWRDLLVWSLSGLKLYEIYREEILTSPGQTLFLFQILAKVFVLITSEYTIQEYCINRVHMNRTEPKSPLFLQFHSFLSIFVLCRCSLYISYVYSHACMWYLL